MAGRRPSTVVSRDAVRRNAGDRIAVNRVTDFHNIRVERDMGIIQLEGATAAGGGFVGQ